MKEYIKLFNNLESADEYIIEDIPFTTTVLNGENKQNIVCNQEGKQLEISGDTVIIVDYVMPTTLYLQDGSTVELTGDTITSAMTSGYKSTLVGVEVGNTVTNIGNSTFSGRTNLSSVTIGNTVTSIGNSAFKGCTSLTSITIGNGVTSISNTAFSGCTSLPVENNIRYADWYLVEATNKTQSSYTIKPETKWIGDYAFSDCTGLTSITIPSGVTSIGSSAFYGCSGLTSITIPSGVTSIGGAAFMNCTSLSSVTIPDSVTSIGSEAFKNVQHIEYHGSATGSPWGALSIN